MNKTDPNGAFRDAIVASKRLLRAQIPDLKDRFDRLTEEIAQEVSDVKAQRDRAECPVPEVNFSALAQVSDAQKDAIRRRGCVVVRGVFEPQQINEWNDDIAQYLTDVKIWSAWRLNAVLTNTLVRWRVRVPRFTACTGPSHKCRPDNLKISRRRANGSTGCGSTHTMVSRSLTPTKS